MKIVIAGASGLVGSSLVPFLKQQGHQVLKLVRKQKDLLQDEIYWNPEKGILEADSLERSDALINLAGENLASKRWTPTFKKQLWDSRIKSTTLLRDKLIQLKKPPSVWLNASAIGFYGNRGAEVLTEKSRKGQGFLSDLCQKWEEVTQVPDSINMRVVQMRFGMILSKNGGALKKMLLPFSLGLGGIMGDGNQYMSWITLEDVIQAIAFILTAPNIKGAVNVMAPESIQNRIFTKALGHALHRPVFFPMPAMIATLVFGEMAEALLLSSARVEPQILEESCFHFVHPSLEQAFRQILS